MYYCKIYNNYGVYMNNKFTFFWYTCSPFSQWHPSLFTVKNIVFTSAEQFMMYSKAVLFGDSVIADEILALNKKVLDDGEDYILKRYAEGQLSTAEILKDKNLKKIWTESQNEIKSLGKKVKNYNEEVWVKNRELIVEEGNFAKFDQNQQLKQSLLNTKGTILVEASPYDKIWGIGLKENDIKAQKEETWEGLNLLGKILTMIRERML